MAHGVNPGVRGAFSIVELLVVIGILGILIGLLSPALAGVLRTNRALVSKSHLRQWGVGTLNYAAMNQDTLPWEGHKGAAGMHLNFTERTWWANAVPPFVGHRPYRELAERSQAGGPPLPLPDGDRDSIFVDPAAHRPREAPYIGGLPGDPKPFFFCYVPNLQLNNQVEAESQGIDAHPRMKLSSIGNASATVLMLEMRSVPWELPGDDPFFHFTLVRARSDWKRLAARHRDGGHVLMADGHVGHVDFVYATTNSAGRRNPEEPDVDWNKPDLIWNPRNRALEGPGH